MNFPSKAKVALISGANTGIGAVTSRVLAAQGYEVYLACKSMERTKAVIDQINEQYEELRAFYVHLDLSDFNSVKNCTETFLKLNKPLHLLINNAGIAGQRGLSKSGFEVAFGVNHMGHFLLTQRLLEILRSSAPSKIVTVASRAHRRAPKIIDWNQCLKPTTSWSGISEYATSKLANILFSSELGLQLQGTGVSTYSLHPGVVNTEVWRELPSILRPLLKLRGMLTPEEGSLTTLHCALKAPYSETGLYYDQSSISLPSPQAEDKALRESLWEFSYERAK